MPAVATIAALLLVTTLIHLDKFDLDSLFGWFWLVVYCLVTPLLAWAITLQVRDAPGRSSAVSTSSRDGADVLALLGAGLPRVRRALYAAPLDVRRGPGP